MGTYTTAQIEELTGYSKSTIVYTAHKFNLGFQKSKGAPLEFFENDKDILINNLVQYRKKPVENFEITEKRKYAIWDLLENIPYGYVITRKGINGYLKSINIGWGADSLADVFISKEMPEIYEDNHCFFFRLEDHKEFVTPEPSEKKLLILMNFYKKR